MEGMVCAACQATVERAAMRLAQVSSAQASASKGTLEVTYAAGVDVDAAEIALAQAILDSGYELVGERHAKESLPSGPAARAGIPEPAGSAAHAGTPQAAGSTARYVLTSLLILAAIGAALLVAHALGLTDVFLAFPTVGSATTYPALFVVGLFTSLHCVAMCGGLNLS